MLRCSVLLAMAVAVLAPYPSAGETAQLLADVNPSIVDSCMEEMRVVGRRLLFKVSSWGTSLWASDGTTDGTLRLTPDPLGGQLSGPFAIDEETLVFVYTARDGETLDLWRTDGTAAGTRRLGSLLPWYGDPDEWEDGVTVEETVILNGSLLLAACTKWPVACTLWATDGTAAGTLRLKDFVVGVDDDDSYLELAFSARDGMLWFSADGEVWQTDGTPAGTVRADGWPPPLPPPPPPDPPQYFFSGSNTRKELWRRDAAGAETLVAVIGRTNRHPWGFGQLGETFVFFVSERTAGIHLWRSDGTAAGTMRVTAPDLGQRIFDSVRFLDMSDIRFFTASDAARGLELWRSDGTAVGTFPVADVNPGPEGSSPSDLTGMDDALLFTATGPDGSRRLWRTDGTLEGTAPLAVVDGGPGGTAFRRTGDALFAFFGRQVWRTDGTAEGTVLLADFPRGAPDSCSGWEMAELDGSLLLRGYDVDGGLELWRTDGTTAGTARVAGIERLGESSWPSKLIEASGTWFFNASEPVGGLALWATDGTPAGTTRLSDTAAFKPVAMDGVLFWTWHRHLWTSVGTSAGTRAIIDETSSGFWQAEHLTEVNGTLFFRAIGGPGGGGLWKSDGTAAGTVPVASFGCPSGTPITGVNGTLFLSVGGGNTGCPGGAALWKSDGTREGTVRVASMQDTSDSLCSGAGGRTCYAAVDDLLLFGAERDGPDDTFDLWKSDGSEAGTTLITHLGGYPSDFTPLDGRLVFTVDGALWGSDGTPAGTQPLTGSALALDFTTAEGTVFFSMGGTLWRSDGTPTGTFQVTPGPTGVRVLASHDGTVFFSAREPEGGLALWRSDGTKAGTARIYRLARNFLSLTPPAAVVNGGLVLPALEPAHGIELWNLPTGNYDTCSPDPPSPPGTCLPPDDPCAQHPGTTSPCDDGDPCTVDGCTPRDGCTHTPLADCVATTTTTSPTSTTSTTLTCSFDTVALCDDADPCTVDICEAGRCQHQLRSGLAGVRCRLRHHAPSFACKDQIPQRLQRRLERARRFVKRAADADDQRKARRRIRRAERQLDAAGKLVARGTERGMGSVCADALERVLAEARAGMNEWLATDRGAERLAEPTPHQRVERDAHFRASSPARRTVSSDRREP